jgi:hypothetical protein
MFKIVPDIFILTQIPEAPPTDMNNYFTPFTNKLKLHKKSTFVQYYPVNTGLKHF